jgi:hypothetical protein
MDNTRRISKLLAVSGPMEEQVVIKSWWMRDGAKTKQDGKCPDKQMTTIK